MIRYRNIGSDSGVDSYQIGENYITVKFKSTHRRYTYSFNRAGRENVKNMKTLAQEGRGLNSYINKHVKFSYD